MANFKTTLIDYDGKPLPQVMVGPDGRVVPSGNELTLRTVAVNALSAEHADERGLSGEDKVKRAALALRIHQQDDVELTAEEIALLKRLVARISPPLVVLRAWAILDPASIPGS